MPSKNEVLTAAAEIADREGLDNLTLGKVAAALDIKTPSLYNHVEGLPGLRRDLAGMGFTQMAAALSKATIGRERDNAVRELSRAYRAFVRTHPGLYAATLKWAGPGQQEAATQGLEIIIAVMQGYGMDQDHTIHAIRGLRAALHGFITLEAIGQFAMPLDIDTSFDLLIETIIAGLRANG